MDLKIPHHDLVQKLAHLGAEAAEARQVAKRIGHLLPEVLSKIERRYRGTNSPARAQRLALRDAQYLGMIDQHLTLQDTALTTLIHWESHRMLYHARQSRE